MAFTTATHTESNALHERSRILIPAVVLAFAAVLAYANSFSVPLLFDDWVTILHNPRLRQIWPIWSALSPPEATGVGGRPIANLSFVLNYAITGESVPGFHAVNLAIHLLAGLTLFGVVRRTLLLPTMSARWRSSAWLVALAAAALWLLHPVQTQSVTYVSQRTESLMGLFFFLTLYAFVRGATAGASRGWFVAAVVSCFAGMGTKEGMVTAPAIVFLYDYAFLSGSWITAWRQRWKLYVSFAASWILLGALMSGLHGRGVGFGLGMSWWSYLLIECRAIMHYLSLGFWPAPLVFDYGTDLGTPGVIEVLSALGLIGLGAGTLVALRKTPAIGFLGAWFLITLAPTSSVVPIPLQPISENRVYVPVAAALTAFVIFVQGAVGRRGVTALFIAALAFAGMTAARNRDYGSEIKIWSDTVAKRPDSARAHSNLGHALQSAGRLAEARQQHELALRLRPQYAEAHVNLAAILGQLGEIDRALEHSRRAVEIDPRNPNAFYNLGVALTQKGDHAGAIAAYESSLRFRTESVDAHGNLALLLLGAGKVVEARAHTDAALRLKPDSVVARYSLACGLALSGRGAEAIPIFQDVIRAQPNHADAYQNLGTVLLQLGRAVEAIAAFENVLRINPNAAASRFGLGNALLTAGRAGEAIPHYEAVLRMSPQSAEVHLNLGVALSQVGRNTEAAAMLETALRLNPQLKAAAESLERVKRNLGTRNP